MTGRPPLPELETSDVIDPDGRWWERWRRLLLTDSRQQQLRLAQSGFAILLMLGGVLMVHALGCDRNLCRQMIWPWTLVSVGGMVAIFLLIRSGLMRRWADPSLTPQQMTHSIICSSMAYVLMGQNRGMVIPMLAVVFMFGMFGMSQRQIMALGGYALMLFGAASWYWLEVGEPDLPPEPEVARYVMVNIVVLGVIVLTGRLHHIRQRLTQQRKALLDALTRIRELATYDELTACLNRRAMIEKLAGELQGLNHKAPTLYLALIDLDHFKRVNDSHGHAAGDAVLREFSRLAKQCLHADDAIARWGGEEFLVLLHQHDLTHALDTMDQLLRKFSNSSFDFLGDSSITFSAGLVEILPGEALAEVIERSDRALYRAKNDGRARIRCG